MSSFEPRRVEPMACWQWTKDGVELSSRGMFRNVLATIILLAPYFFLKEDAVGYAKVLRNIYSFISTPYSICFFVFSAELSNNHESCSIAAFKEFLHRATSLGLLYAGLCCLILSVGSALRTLFPFFDFAGTATPVEHGAYYFEAGHSLASNLGPYLILAGFNWFIAALCVSANAPSILVALRLAISGTDLNRFVTTYAITLYMFVSMLMMLSGFLIMPIYAILGGIMYASYRDVYLGEGISEKQKKTVSIPVFSH